jgi:hypothetical protein
MNQTKQFWALFKFQTTINPFIWFMPFAFSGTLWLPLLDGYQPPLSSSLYNFNLFFVGFLAVMVLAPDLFYTTATQNIWASGTEFLLTRATDRNVVYRSKSIFLYLLVLMVPLALLFIPSKGSALKTTEYSKTLQQECVSKLPGTTLSKDKYGSTDQLTIPNGKVLINSWNIWTTLLTALASQIIIWTIYPLKYRRYLFGGIYAVVIFGPFFMISRSAAELDLLSPSEKLFLLFAPHQGLAWISTILAAILAQLWCERRFARLEQ